MKRFVIVIFILTHVSLFSQYDWTKIDFPASGAIDVVEINGDHLYAAGWSLDGVYVTHKENIQWRNIGLTGHLVYAIFAQDNYVLVSVLDGLYKTTDFGANWIKVSELFFDSFWNSDTVLFGGGRGLYKSIDNGNTWELFSLWDPFTYHNGDYWNIQQIFEFNNILFTLIPTQVSVHMYRSTNWGESWQRISSADGLQYLYESNGSLYSMGSTLYKSIDQGLTWTKIGSQLPYGTSTLHMINNNNNFLIGTNRGIYKTSDEGLSWEKINIGTSNNYVRNLISKDSIIMSSSDDGVTISFDNGISWANESNGINNPFINILISNGTSLFAGTGGAGLYRSSDNGENWDKLNIKEHDISDLLYAHNRLYGIFYSKSYTGNDTFYYSENDGDDWIASDYNFFSMENILESGENLFATGSRYLKSTDYGKNWNTVEIAPNVISKDSIFIALKGKSIFRSADNGGSWDSITTFQNPMHKVEISDGILYALGSPNILYRSNDDGLSWDMIMHEPIPNGRGRNFSVFGFDTYLFVGASQGLFLSEDKGLDWELHTNVSPAGSFVNHNGILYAGTSSGIFRLNDLAIPVELINFSANYFDNKIILSWSTITEKNNQGFEIQRRKENSEFISIGYLEGNGTTTEINNYTFIDQNPGNVNNYYRLKQIDLDGSYEYSQTIEVDITPQEFSLSQNYPNPFNPSTTIEYSLPSTGHVLLKVYDVLGNEITTLVNDQKESGFYSINFDASKYASGVYAYSLSVNGERIARKMLLQK